MIHAPEMRIIEAISVSHSVNDVDVCMTGCNIGVMGHVTTDHPCHSSCQVSGPLLGHQEN